MGSQYCIMNALGNNAVDSRNHPLLKDLISNFKSALSHCNDIIKAKWNDNQWLQNGIKNLDEKQAKKDE